MKMSDTYFNVPTTSIKPMNQARAYTEAMRRWKVQYGYNRQDNAGIIYSNGLQEVAVKWADLPAIKREYE